MRKARLHALLCPPQEISPVQPKPVSVSPDAGVRFKSLFASDLEIDADYVPEQDADGNPIPEY